MFKKISLIIIGILLLSSKVTLSKEQKKSVDNNLAEVVILKFENKTGSKNYNWLKTSLPDAIYESMKKTFEFKRLISKQIEKELINKKTKINLSDSKKIESISKNNSADIIIFGKYTYNKKKKIIIISVKIFHSSRNSVTGKIEIKTKIDTSLFNVVDKVSEKCVSHIKQIALKDIETAKKLSIRTTKNKSTDKNITEKEKKEESKESSKRIVLIKTKPVKKEEKKIPDSWHWGFGLKLVVGIETLQNDEAGGGISLFYTSHLWKSFFYEVFVQASAINKDPDGFKDSLIEVDKIDMLSASIRIGYNLKLFNRVSFRPYGGIGLCSMTFNYNDSSTENSNYAIILTGIQFPVRWWGDNYITPFIEYFWLPTGDFIRHLGMINFGLNFSF